MKNRERLKGLIAATFTPMLANGEVNYDEIGNYARYIEKTGINGVFVCGTTGESTSLTTSERKQILSTWVKEAKGAFKIIAHVGSNCQHEAMELASHAQTCGADGIAAIAPSFFKPATVTDLVQFFKPIAASAGNLPFYYYNMPAMTGVNLAVDQFLLEGKKHIPTLAGTKFTHNNLMEMGVCLALNDGEFEVLHGYDEILITGLAMGAVAGVGSTYNYIPSVYQGIIEAMQNNDVEKARILQMR
ncbi:dihydrodipicolinate synthase family protein, partial [Macellibacteroides fermentans]|uniref:dihydrodipicolinate synthase family protein n=1 Tax=Macellibacteroides fermentans TaxID=879969 RepID=UPI002B38FC59|nr:dihydrodipicolinate synthase family protein [Macellibacteroides fermentans]